MSRFTDTVKQETPRLVITYHRDETGMERFQWGVVGKIPLMSLIGALCRVQAVLPDVAGISDDHHCPEPALVITWDDDFRLYDWFVHPSVPVAALVGMMEVVKITVVMSQQGRQAGNQQFSILGPDGNPMRR